MNQTLNNSAPAVLSVLRIFTALELLAHGTAKHLGFPVVPHYAHLQHLSLTGVAGLFELFGGFLLLIGLFTRPVAFILSGFTAVAYFMVHLPKNFFPILNGGELAALFSFICIYFVFAGAGPISLDAILWHRKQADVAQQPALRRAA